MFSLIYDLGAQDAATKLTATAYDAFTSISLNSIFTNDENFSNLNILCNSVILDFQECVDTEVRHHDYFETLAKVSPYYHIPPGRRSNFAAYTAQ